MLKTYTGYKPPRLALYLVAGLVVLGVIFKLLAIAPTWIHFDENYYLNISQNYILRGQLTPYMLRLDPDMNIIAGSGTGYGILMLTIWMQLVGNTLVNGRILMVLAGLLSALVMYFVGRKWWDSPVAGVTAAVFALVSTSPFYSLIMRMDALAMLAYSVILLMHIHAVRDNKRWLHFATGITLVMAVEVHVLSIAYIIAITVYYAIIYGRQVMSTRRIILDTGLTYYALGGLIAGVVYIAVHILPNPEAYFAIPSQCSICEPASLSKEMIRFSLFFLMRLIEAPLLLLAIWAAIYRRRSEDIHFIVLVAAWFIALIIVAAPPLITYTYHIWPLTAIGVAGYIMRGLRPEGIFTRQRYWLGTALLLVMVSFNFGLHVMERQPFEIRMATEYGDPVAYIREQVPEDTTIMAHVVYFYPLQEYVNFLSYRDVSEVGVTLRGETHLEFWQREKPLVIILHPWMDGDDELEQYMDKNNFAEVLPGLMIAEELRTKLGVVL